MNILSKLNQAQAMTTTEEAQLEANELVSMVGHIKNARYRSLPNFVVYSSRRVRSQLNR